MLAPANNVRVLLTKILKKSPDGLWLEQTFSGPVQVTWNLHLDRSMYATIGPDDSAVFGNLEKSARSFILQLYYYPNNLEGTIESNQPTRLVFKAVSDTAESKELTIEVEWDGVWEEDRIKMKGHCKVAEIT
jgi:hypothetical protein